MRWTCLPFAQLQVQQLYDALALRSEVFVVEQQACSSTSTASTPRACI